MTPQTPSDVQLAAVSYLRSLAPSPKARPHRRHRFGWIGSAPNCTVQYHDELSYYCQQHDSLSRIADLVHMPLSSANSVQPASAAPAAAIVDALIVPLQCSANVRLLPVRSCHLNLILFAAN